MGRGRVERVAVWLMVVVMVVLLLMVVVMVVLLLLSDGRDGRRRHGARVDALHSNSVGGRATGRFPHHGQLHVRAGRSCHNHVRELLQWLSVNVAAVDSCDHVADRDASTYGGAVRSHGGHNHLFRFITYRAAAHARAW